MGSGASLSGQLDTNRAFSVHPPGMLAVWANFERPIIGQRTKDALAVKRQQGVGPGVRVDARGYSSQAAPTTTPTAASCSLAVATR